MLALEVKLMLTRKSISIGSRNWCKVQRSRISLAYRIALEGVEISSKSMLSYDSCMFVLPALTDARINEGGRTNQKRQDQERIIIIEYANHG